jgi:hypothetical protein
MTLHNWRSSTPGILAICLVAAAAGCDESNAQGQGTDARYVGSVSIASPDDSWSSCPRLAHDARPLEGHADLRRVGAECIPNQLGECRCGLRLL